MTNLKKLWTFIKTNNLVSISVSITLVVTLAVTLTNSNRESVNTLSNNDIIITSTPSDGQFIYNTPTPTATYAWGIVSTFTPTPTATPDNRSIELTLASQGISISYPTATPTMTPTRTYEEVDATNEAVNEWLRNTNYNLRVTIVYLEHLIRWADSRPYMTPTPNKYKTRDFMNRETDRVIGRGTNNSGDPFTQYVSELCLEEYGEIPSDEIIRRARDVYNNDAWISNLYSESGYQNCVYNDLYWSSNNGHVGVGQLSIHFQDSKTITNLFELDENLRISANIWQGCLATHNNNEDKAKLCYNGTKGY